MRFSLRRKVIATACAAAIIPIVAMFIITDILEERLQTCMTGEVRSLIESHVSQLTSDLYEECRTSDLLLTEETERASMALQSFLHDSGTVEISKRTSDWTVDNHRTEGQTRITVPIMTIGGKKLTYAKRKQNPLPLLTKTSRISGAYCTIYQRLNPEGDMLVVDTTAPKTKNYRNLGSLFYSLGSNGRVSTVIDDILSGRTVKNYENANHGTRFVVYSPLRDQDNFVVGMLAVHMEDSIVESLRKSMLKTTIGKTGYVWVIGTRGSDKGKYIVSGSTKDDGAHVNTVGSRKGFVEELIDQAEKAGEGKLNSKQYLWKTDTDDTGRIKLSVFTYFKPWGWVIGTGVYLDEYQAISKRLTGVLDTLVEWLVGTGLLLLIITLIVAYYVSGRIANPVSHMVELVKTVAGGDLLAAKNTLEELNDSCPNARHAMRNINRREALDETGQLYLAVRDMVETLFSLVAQVQRSGIQVTTSSTEIAASARQLEVTVNQQAVATNQISATSTEISANSGELAGTMHHVNESAAGMATLAHDGQDGLKTMIRIMDELSRATSSITDKLAEINERANSIEGIVGTITKVADRTNLLSLNAAIEAEKAGKFGQGFSVVAAEIRRLADQTSVAALEIEKMIGNMRFSVDSGVLEMNKFAEDVRFGASKASKLGKKLEGIMNGVRELTPRIELVNDGMTAQAEGAGQISEAMVQLSDTASDTSEALGEFNRAATQLNEAVQGLRNEVSSFKVSE
ncbi:methyl-accepting chemotaxis protein [Maridesulfovibrio hydrothermalis]|uniref:Methyl-accepting chemotaxis sensory transducer n=1 Tax=Maridesulfovibrio hydrothermalis AM13 = DSM 14728 TaxID=1121451 RepID=L0R8Q4_9BACT|nr:methyl-accepting chemotaxis protein [Maridesulfovibrio hydrothermalis]CCO23139.1 Methyl-accepting chemotaxis sensory transducer [Maridesulfovibrio hydrothermalis AM13 = DSM 14728]